MSYLGIRYMKYIYTNIFLIMNSTIHYATHTDILSGHSIYRHAYIYICRQIQTQTYIHIYIYNMYIIYIHYIYTYILYIYVCMYIYLCLYLSIYVYIFMSIYRESRQNICVSSIMDSTVNNDKINSKKNYMLHCALQKYWKNIVLLHINCYVF